MLFTLYTPFNINPQTREGGGHQMRLIIIEDAEDFMVLSCCEYHYYNEVIPWDLDLEDE